MNPADTPLARASEFVDERATAIADLGPDDAGALIEGNRDELYRLLANGTGIDVDAFRGIVEHMTRQAVDLVRGEPRLLAVIFAGYLRSAILTGYHAHRLELEDASA